MPEKQTPRQQRERDRNALHDQLETSVRKEAQMPERKTAEQLQAESQAALARIRPIMESVDMSIRQERADNKSLEAAFEDLKAINQTFLRCQKAIRGGEAAR